MTATSLKTLVACALLYASTCWARVFRFYLDTSTSEATQPLVDSFKEELAQSSRLFLTATRKAPSSICIW